MARVRVRQQTLGDSGRISDRLRFILQQHCIERTDVIAKCRSHAGTLYGFYFDASRTRKCFRLVAACGEGALSVGLTDTGDQEPGEPLLSAMVTRNSARVTR